MTKHSAYEDTIVDVEPNTVAEEALCGAIHVADNGVVVFRPYGEMIAIANGKLVVRKLTKEPGPAWVKRRVNEFAAHVLAVTKPKRTRKKRAA